MAGWVKRGDTAGCVFPRLTLRQVAVVASQVLPGSHLPHPSPRCTVTQHSPMLQSQDSFTLPKELLFISQCLPY